MEDAKIEGIGEITEIEKIRKMEKRERQKVIRNLGVADLRYEIFNSTVRP